MKNNKPTMTPDEIEGAVLAELSNGPRMFKDMIPKLGGYHGGNYRALDRQLQSMKTRKLIRYHKGTGWKLAVA